MYLKIILKLFWPLHYVVATAPTVASELRVLPSQRQAENRLIQASGMRIFSCTLKEPRPRG